jgi:predicted HicB family RNase H-like nuclease
MPSQRVIFAFRIRPELKAVLEKLAAEDKRSVSSYIEKALDEHVTRVTKQAGKKR